MKDIIDLVVSCDSSCPWYDDPDPYPCECLHPNGSCNADWRAKCPLKDGGTLVTVEAK